MAEYRESVDIDFLVSSSSGYQELRSLLKGKLGIQALCRSGTKLNPVRDLRIDQYGIRTMLRVAETEIKFEIVFEARIDLEIPSELNKICGVKTLTTIDMGATKFLANSDRWNDRSVFSRDLIDLAMLNLSAAEYNNAFKKAEAAYGKSVEQDLNKSIQYLTEDKTRLEECMIALKVDTVSKAQLWSRIRKLRR